MELTFWILLWITSLVFTVCSFVKDWRKLMIFPLLAGVFWNVTALSLTQIHYVGYGSTNIIIYSHELGDWSGDVGLMYLCHGVGVIMLVFALYNGLLVAKGDLDMVEKGRAFEWEKVNR